MEKPKLFLIATAFLRHQNGVLIGYLNCLQKKDSVEKYDYEYERNGVSNLFMLSAPLEGWRHVKVGDRHTKIDWAHLMKDLVDLHYRDKKIILVMDNLNAHKLGSL